VVRLIRHSEVRFQLTQASPEVREKLLGIRRSLLQMLMTNEESYVFDCQKEIGNAWLASAQLAREAKNFQTAFSAILQAKRYAVNPDLSLRTGIEAATLHWDQGHLSEAVSHLKKFLDFESLSEIPVPTVANANLLLSKWMIETARYDADVVLSKLNSVIHLFENSQSADESDEFYQTVEEAYFTLAQYCDNVVEMDVEKRSSALVGIVDVIKNYGATLKHGSKYIFRALPRLLTVWFDHGTKALEAASKSQGKPAIRMPQTSNRNSEQAVNEEMSKLANSIATYQLLIALPQLTSRICHASPDILHLLDLILVRLIQDFPNQTLWMMMAMYKSTYKPRQQRCAEVLKKAEDKVVPS
jgi:serine/threonine-protein kinase ATR